MTSLTSPRSSKRPLKTVLLLLAGGLAAAAAGTAGAAPAADVPTDVLYYSPATLASDSGVQSLYHRIARAAEKVCENQHESGTRLPSDAELQCRRHAVEEAVANVHNTRLAALADSRSKSG
jgi:UrcA family protein